MLNEKMTKMPYFDQFPLQRNDALSSHRQAATAGPISVSAATVTTTSSLSRAEAMRGKMSRANSKEDEAAPFVVERTGDYMEAKTLPKISKYDHLAQE